jgi:hypothetical protein
MAVTLTANNGSAYDDIFISAISSASGQTDLKYIVEIYKGASKLFEGKVYPEPTNKRMYFDISPIGRNAYSEEFFDYDFSNNFNVLASGFTQGVLNVRIGTDYSGITTLNEASANCFIVPERSKFFNRRWSKVSAPVDLGNKWLTDRSLVSSLSNNSDNFYIGFLLDGDVSIEIKYEEYNASNAITSSSSYVSLGTAGPKRMINIGPDSLNSLIGSKPNLNTCAYYKVYVRSYDNDISDYRILTFRINKHCENKYQSIPIHFWNRLHCVDTMRFDLVSRTTVDVERKSYNQRDYRFSGSSVLYTDSSASGTTVYRENKINYNAVYNYTMKLTSDFLDDQDWEWLEDLIESPKIYMEDDGYFYPVTIKATNYEISKYINNRLRPLEIEIEFNSPRLSSAR